MAVSAESINGFPFNNSASQIRVLAELFAASNVLDSVT